MLVSAGPEALEEISERVQGLHRFSNPREGLVREGDHF